MSYKVTPPQCKQIPYCNLPDLKIPRTCWRKLRHQSRGVTEANSFQDVSRQHSKTEESRCVYNYSYITKMCFLIWIFLLWIYTADGSYNLLAKILFISFSATLQENTWKPKICTYQVHTWHRLDIWFKNHTTFVILSLKLLYMGLHRWLTSSKWWVSEFPLILIHWFPIF
jgi:hypothetical protein